MVMMLVLIVVMVILLSGALFLALIAYALHSRGNQLKQMHLVGHAKEDQKFYGHHQPHEQQCCMCGNLRSRKPHAEPEELVLEKEDQSSSGKLWKLLQPFVESACENSVLKHGKGHIARETSLNLLENVDKLKDLRAKLQSAISRSKSSSLGDVSRIESTLPSDLNRNLKIDHEVASMRSIGSSVPVFSPPSDTLSSSELNSDVPLNNGVADNMKLKQEPKKRLVLEILVSPSQASDENAGQFQHATGVRLKLETNTSFGSLASFAATAATATSSGVEHDSAERIETDSRNDMRDEATCKIRSGTLLALDKDFQNIGGLIRIGEVDIHATGQAAKQAVQSDQSNLVEVDCIQHGNLHKNGHLAATSLTAGQLGNACMLDSAAEGGIRDDTSLLSSPQNMKSSRLCKLLGPIVSSVSIPLAETTETSGCNTKTMISANTGIFDDPGKESCKRVMQQQVKSSSSPLNFTTLEGLGYLQIQSLEAGSKSKSYINGGTADIVSALTALTVDAVGENSTGKGGVSHTSLCGDSCLKGSSLKKNCKKQMHEYINDDEAHGGGSGSEQGTEEIDEHNNLLKAQSSANQILSSMSKKEKKKKKNRIKRQNAKLAVATSSDKEAQALQESSKCLPVSCKHNETSNLVEVGCLCGSAIKEGLHSHKCPDPFTSSGSMIQRKLKEQYDDLVRSNINKTLTLAQVGRFTTSLLEAKALLQHKSDLVQRKFTITKSLLCKADKSSFDRLCGQIYGLEFEQRRIEEDTIVYNRLQEQLKLSPAYQKMLEYGRTHFQSQPNTNDFIEKLDGEAKEISFEELLAQEKKDSFWQKYGLSRSSVQVN